MLQFSEDQLKWFDKQNKARPSTTPHGVTTDDLSEHVKQMKPESWTLEGNKLTGQTDMGPFVQYIDPSKVMVGVDTEGLPIFRDIVLQLNHEENM